MSSGKLWSMGMQEAEEHRATLVERLRLKHLSIMKRRKDFSATFGVDLKRFYTNIYVGFDVVKFDDWMRENVEAYDEDKESMADFIVRKYGDDARAMVKSFI